MFEILNDNLHFDHSTISHRYFANKCLHFSLDCQVNLYGSVYFECCLEKPGAMDIDIQFKEILQYDALKEILEDIANLEKDFRKL